LPATTGGQMESEALQPTQKEFYELWKQSGLSKAEFARQNQIAENKFYNLCANLERAKNKAQPPIVKPEPKFIEIKPTVAKPAKSLIITTPAGYSLEVP